MGDLYAILKKTSGKSSNVFRWRLMGDLITYFADYNALRIHFDSCNTYIAKEGDGCSYMVAR